MKSTLYIVNAVMVVAIVILFVLFFGNKQEEKTVAPVQVEGGVSVAYVRMDSLLLNYNVYKTMSEELLKQEESARATLNQKAVELQREMEDFQMKLENRAFLSEERARAAQDNILRKQRNLQELTVKMEQDLVTKQKQMNDQLAATVDSVINVYNSEKGFTFILSTAGTDNILYGEKSLNITNDVLQLLNQPAQ
ncbi:MAG: OmpH family outer membrane protein [Paludibacteraceae bacterium]|jgi:outer membrane protein|nr:OmpH family outer membrane protein [Paludibacteraceae bacterium]MEE1184379.1 OmpH family outer membrane protein [Paludibacteraceae bacterium]